jgi:hypothetical protein
MVCCILSKLSMYYDGTRKWVHAFALVVNQDSKSAVANYLDFFGVGCGCGIGR